MQLTLQMIQKVAEAKREIQREIAMRMLQKEMAPALISELTNVAEFEILEMRRKLANGPKHD